MSTPWLTVINIMRGFTDRTDTDLLQLMQAGDHGAFQEIHARYAASMYKSALSLLGDHDLAEDVVQDVFCVIWEKRDTLHIKSTLSGYIYGITRFTALAQLKNGKHLRQYIDILKHIMDIYTESPDTVYIQREKLQQVESAISVLPDRMREILTIARIGSHTYREIAVLLGITESRVKNSVSEAVKVLRTKLQLFLFALL